MERQNDNSLTNFATKAIFDIIINFDFEKVKNVMEFLGWTWAKLQANVPDKSEIQDEAYRLLTDCYHAYWNDTDRREGSYSISCGGLKASYEYLYDKDVDDDQRDCFSLSFIVEAYGNLL